jgi:RNA polymerase sigma-70 factor (ECF subfamily)
MATQAQVERQTLSQPAAAQGGLRRAFLEGAAPERRGEFAELVDLEARLQAELAKARKRYPGLSVGAGEFAAGSARWIGKTAARTALDAAAFSELYLMCGCVASESLAWAYFDADYFDRARAALRRMGRSADDIEEILQQVRHRLLLPEEGEPRLARYVGKGDLGALVRVAATRIAIDWARKTRRHLDESEDEILRLPACSEDPELAVLKQQCCGHFEAAFSAAVAGLQPRQRNLLRLHIVDGVPLHALARSYKVHKTTVVRWLVKARADLLEALGAELQQRLSLGGEELAEMVALIRSRVELSLHRMLKTIQS